MSNTNEQSGKRNLVNIQPDKIPQRIKIQFKHQEVLEDVPREVVFDQITRLGVGGNGIVYRCTVTLGDELIEVLLTVAVKVDISANNDVLQYEHIIMQITRIESSVDDYEHFIVSLNVRDRQGKLLMTSNYVDATLIYADGSEADGKGLVMEYLQGEDLSKYDFSDLNEALQLADEWGYALDLLVAAGVPNPDTKLENVMVVTRTNGQKGIKIIDLGFGVILAANNGEVTLPPGAPSAGSFGTFATMYPPMIAEAENRSPAFYIRCQQWSYFSSLFQKLFGLFPLQLPDTSSYNNFFEILQDLDSALNQTQVVYTTEQIQRNPNVLVPFGVGFARGQLSMQLMGLELFMQQADKVLQQPIFSGLDKLQIMKMFLLFAHVMNGLVKLPADSSDSFIAAGVSTINRNDVAHTATIHGLGSYALQLDQFVDELEATDFADNAKFNAVLQGICT